MELKVLYFYSVQSSIFLNIRSCLCWPLSNSNHPNLCAQKTKDPYSSLMRNRDVYSNRPSLN